MLFIKNCLNDGATAPENCIVINYPSYYFEEIKYLYESIGIEFPFSPLKKYKRSMSIVLKNHFCSFDFENIPWKKVIPEHELKAIDDYVNEVNNIISKVNNNEIESYINNCFLKECEVFSFLKPAKISREEMKKFLPDDLFRSKYLNLFSSNGFIREYTNVPRYSRDTVTGRLKIIGGFNILAFPKKYRSVFASNFGKEGKVYYFDFSSLEPRIMLYLNNKFFKKEKELKIGDDIYSDFAIKYGIKVEREVIKRIIVMKIYGSANDSIKEVLEKEYKLYERDLGIELEYLEKAIEDEFGINEFKNKLMDMINVNGGRYIFNYYGRPIDLQSLDISRKHLLINWYIQSTAVDISLLGFRNMIKYLMERGLLYSHVIPLFIIHDCIVLDIKENSDCLLEDLTRVGGELCYGFEDIRFPISVSTV